MNTKGFILFQKYKKSLQAKEWDPLAVNLQSFLDRIELEYRYLNDFVINPSSSDLVEILKENIKQFRYLSSIR